MCCYSHRCKSVILHATLITQSVASVLLLLLQLLPPGACVRAFSFLSYNEPQTLLFTGLGRAEGVQGRVLFVRARGKINCVDHKFVCFAHIFLTKTCRLKLD